MNSARNPGIVPDALHEITIDEDENTLEVTGELVQELVWTIERRIAERVAFGADERGQISINSVMIAQLKRLLRFIVESADQSNQEESVNSEVGR